MRVPDATMRGAVESIFTTLGMTESYAAKCADVLIYADVRGIDSHGVSNMMRAYVAGLKGGHINPTPVMKRERDFPAAVPVDGDRGLGQGKELMELAIERARDNGVAVVTAGNSGHYGPSAYFAHLALEHDMIGVSMTAGGVQVAPTHGAEPLLGLNPIGIAAPSMNEPPFIFDASMSSVAGNKIHLLRRVGGKVLPGWITDADGAPIMEEAEVPDRFLSPQPHRRSRRQTSTANQRGNHGDQQFVPVCMDRFNLLDELPMAHLDRSAVVDQEPRQADTGGRHGRALQNGQ